MVLEPLTPEERARHKRGIEKVRRRLFRRHASQDYFIVPNSERVIDSSAECCWNAACGTYRVFRFGGLSYAVDCRDVHGLATFTVLHLDSDRFAFWITAARGIPPHKHPVDEHITVVQGTLYFAVGDKFDRAAMQEIKTGGYAFIPKGSTMFGYIPAGDGVQVHGIGPFHIHWRAGAEWRDKDQTLDDPGSTSVFKFKKGDRVVGSRGSGRISQGYFSGEILQYEVTGDDGALFMASEDEIRRL